MRGLPEVQPRPEFVSDLRAQLIAAADTDLVPTDISRLRLPERRSKRERRIASIVGGIAIVGATTSVALASQSALPGESLYPVKRIIESAHSSISVGEADKGSTMLGNASSRLDEATALSQDPGLGDDQRIADTLSTFTEQATDAADLLFADYADSGNQSSITELHDFASSGLDQLEALEPLVPAEARDELLSAASALVQIDTEAAQRCPECGGPAIDSIPPSLVAAQSILVPVQPAPAPIVRQHRSDQGKSADGKPVKNRHHQSRPDVTEDGVGPGTVRATTPVTPPTVTDPLKSLTNGLTGGNGNSGKPSTRGTKAPVVGDVLDGVDDLLQGVINPLTGLPEE